MPASLATLAAENNQFRFQMGADPRPRAMGAGWAASARLHRRSNSCALIHPRSRHRIRPGSAGEPLACAQSPNHDADSPAAPLPRGAWAVLTIGARDNSLMRSRSS